MFETYPIYFIQKSYFKTPEQLKICSQNKTQFIRQEIERIVWPCV